VRPPPTMTTRSGLRMRSSTRLFMADFPFLPPPILAPLTALSSPRGGAYNRRQRLFSRIVGRLSFPKLLPGIMGPASRFACPARRWLVGCRQLFRLIIRSTERRAFSAMTGSTRTSSRR
jgi:hypothetical protein